MASHAAVIAVRRSPVGQRKEEEEAGRMVVVVPSPPDQDQEIGGLQPPSPEVLASLPVDQNATVLTGDVKVEGSERVAFENVTVFQGPVTVKQVHVTNGHGAKAAEAAGVPGGGDYGDDDAQMCGMGPCAFRWALGILALSLGLIVVVVLLATLLSGGEMESTSGGDKAKDSETVKAIAAEIGAYNGDKLLLVSRKEWGGQPPVAPADPMTLPVPYVIVSHTATEHCFTFEDCTAVVRSIQAFHMGSRQWWDVGYNFMVGGDGRAYEGRGWDRIGAHARSYNNVSIGLSFIGTFIDVEPPERQVKAAMRLIEEGVKLGKVAEDYDLLGHRQVSSTESPGEKLYQMIKTWPHWAEPSR